MLKAYGLDDVSIMIEDFVCQTLPDPSKCYIVITCYTSEWVCRQDLVGAKRKKEKKERKKKS